jgi:hypothetical protein
MAEAKAGLSWPCFGKRIARSAKQAMPSGIEIGEISGAR